MLRVDQIRPNPRNVRRSLELDDEFLDSIAANGVTVPVVVVDQGDETYELKMGHRRHAASRLRNVEEIPAVILDPDLREAAEDYIEQLIENESAYRRGLTPLEQADALFGAVSEGKSAEEVARRTGRAVDEITLASQASKGLGQRSRTVIEASEAYDLDLEVLAALGEFDDDPEAVERLVRAHKTRSFTYRLSQEREARAERIARDGRRAQLRKDGIQLWEDVKSLPPRAQWLEELVNANGDALDPAAHTRCPGHAVVWDDSGADGDVAAVAAVCLNPSANGHRIPRSERPASADAEDLPDDEQETDEEAAERAREKADRLKEAEAARAQAEAEAAAARRRKHAYNTAGNRAYRAATETRRAWLRDLIARKTAPKALAGWVTQTLLAAPKPVRQWDGGLGRTRILAELLGVDRAEDSASTAGERITWTGGNATPTRLTMVNFAILAACYEKRMDPANSWRQDNPEIDTEEIRADARLWLRFLAEQGYELSPIELNLVDDTSFVEAADTDQPEGLPADEPAKEPGV
jgi:ParB family chromosome partitioning protein